MTLKALQERDAGPVGTLLPLLASCIRPDALPLLVHSLVAGRTRTSVQAFAAGLGMAPRTLEALHSKHRLPSPKRMLVWGLVFWAAWRRDRWGLSAGAAASAMGFQRSSELAACLRPVLSGDLDACRSLHAWEQLLESFDIELRNEAECPGRMAPSVAIAMSVRPTGDLRIGP
jgi:hypothetical protein